MGLPILSSGRPGSWQSWINIAIKDYYLKTVVVPVDPNANEKYEDAEAKAKCMILDGVKDHVIPHIAEENTTKEMWETLNTLYQGSSL